jgi:hypothetical protein
LSVLAGKQLRTVVAGGPLLIDFVVTLGQGRDGAIWAGTYGKGLWRIKGDEQHLYTTADGLSSDQIRSLYQDPDGTLWIRLGGGLNALRDGKFSHFTAKDGLLSDNVAKVTWRIALAEYHPGYLPDRQTAVAGLRPAPAVPSVGRWCGRWSAQRGAPRVFPARAEGFALPTAVSGLPPAGVWRC